MIHELPPDAVERVRPVFAHIPNRTPVDALIEGSSAGRFFVDDPQQPRAAFVWDDFHYSYLAGQPHASFTSALRDLLTGELLPQARRSPDPSLVIYPDSPAWVGWINRFQPIHAARKIFRFDPARFQPVTPDGFTVEVIDAARLNAHPDLQGLVGVLWRSPALFLQKGYGVCVEDRGTLVSLCVTGFVGGRAWEIDISTHPDDRRRGYAFHTASAFIAECLRRGFTPSWECWDTNQPSARLAEKLGFVGVCDHPVYVLDLTRNGS